MKFDAISVKELNQPNSVEIIGNSSLVVNTTPVGMYPNIDESIVNVSKAFVKDQIVFDLVYNPVKTKFLQLAEANGASVISGLKMLVEQAGKSFTLWTKVEFPAEKVYKSLLFYLNK
jgi:shikimate dehydrogenase